MPSSSPRGRGGAARRAVAAAVAACLGVIALGAPATAHDQLTGSDPAADATVDAWPTEARLEYSSELLEIGATIAVMDDAGTDWADGDPSVAGTVATVPLRADAPNGPYEIQWRVVSSDGHPIEGTVTFTLAGAAPITSPSTTPEPTLEPTASGQPTAAAASPSTTPSPAQPDPSGGEQGKLGTWGVVGLALLAALLTGAAVWRRRGVDHSRLGGSSEQAD